MRLNHMHVAFIAFLVMIAGNLSIVTATVSAPVVELERSIHFLTPSGDDVLVEAGEYEVEAAEEWIRLIPKGGARSEAVLLAAGRSLHLTEVSAPEVRSIRGLDEEDVWLLLPNGQSWLAEGSYSGVRKRNVTGDVRLLGGMRFQGTPKEIFDKVEHSLGFCLMVVEEGWAGAFTWDSQTKSCRTFNSNSTGQQVADPRYVSGIRGAPFTNLQWTYNTTYQAHVIWPEFYKDASGYNYRTYPNKSLESCQVQCISMVNPDGQGCMGFSWYKDMNTCYVRSTFKGLSSDPRFISGILMNYAGAKQRFEDEMWKHQTAKYLPRCINAALKGPEVKYLRLWGQDWHCKPAKITHLKNVALQTAEGFGKYNGSLIEGTLSHHRSYVIDDQAHYTIFVERISADKTIIHNFDMIFDSGGFFETPIIGWIAEQGIKYGVGNFTGVPFSGDLALKGIKYLESQGNTGTKNSADRISRAIALSAAPVLPISSTVSGIVPAVMLLLN